MSSATPETCLTPQLPGYGGVVVVPDAVGQLYGPSSSISALRDRGELLRLTVQLQTAGI